MFWNHDPAGLRQQPRDEFDVHPDVPDPQLQGAGQYSNISTTQRYMHLDDQELADAQDLVD